MAAKLKIKQTLEAKCDGCGKEKVINKTTNHVVRDLRRTYGSTSLKPKYWCSTRWGDPTELKGMIFCSTSCREKIVRKAKRIINKYKQELKNGRFKKKRFS